MNSGQLGWQKIIYRKYTWQASQDGVQPRIRLYEVHQNIAVNIDITFANIWIPIWM